MHSYCTCQLPSCNSRIASLQEAKNVVFRQQTFNHRFGQNCTKTVPVVLKNINRNQTEFMNWRPSLSQMLYLLNITAVNCSIWTEIVGHKAALSEQCEVVYQLTVHCYKFAAVKVKSKNQICKVP